jgi:leader peptidase (prepilin peptidase)/N-methyltransferase
MLDLLGAYPALWSGTAVALGLVVGSFINVVTHRLPRVWDRDQVGGVVEWAEVTAGQLELAFPRADPERRARLGAVLAEIAKCAKEVVAALPDESLARPRSRCPACGHAIPWYENVPLASFLMLRGRCSACRSPIGMRYPLVEAFCGVVAGLIAARFGFSLAAATALLLFFWLVPLAIIDAETTWLPNSVTLPLLWAGLAVNLAAVWAPLPHAVAGALGGYLFLAVPAWLFEHLRGIAQAMGRGDFALMAALGAWFGIAAILPIAVLACVAALVVALPLLASGKRDLLARIPFGPYLALAGMGYLFFGATLRGWAGLGWAGLP